MGNELFKYFKETDNDQFSTLQGLDLQDLLYYMDTYYLKLRENIGLKKDITFGLEIEFEDCDLDFISDNINKSSWVVKEDISLKNGGEINSPVLTDDIQKWNDLKDVCLFLKNNSSINGRTGGHVHIGRQIIRNNKDTLLNFLKIWYVYENVICRFTNGEFVNGRYIMRKYAKSCAEDFQKNFSLFENHDNSFNESLHKLQSLDKKSMVHFSYNKDTIEFRSPNGTFNPIIWQNNVNLFVNILKYSNTILFDDDIIKKRQIELGECLGKRNLYNEIYLQQALELSDLVFDNNLDKVYFLRQYLKSFEINKKVNNKLKKAKTFTTN